MAVLPNFTRPQRPPGKVCALLGHYLFYVNSLSCCVTLSHFSHLAGIADTLTSFKSILNDKRWCLYLVLHYSDIYVALCLRRF